MSEFKAGVRVSLPASLSWVLWVSLGTLSGRGEPTLTNGQFVTRSWLKEDGLPQNTVTAVTQTRAGYLWVGTYNGLARFDGVKFTCFDSINTPEMGSSRVTSLFADREGTLWIGCEGGELTRLAGEKFQPVPVRGQWGARSIHVIASDQAGDTWIFNHTDCLLARLRDGLVLRAESGHWGEWAQMVSSPGGAIWVLRNGRVSQLEHGQLRPLELEDTNHQELGVEGIGAGREAGLWVAVQGRLKKLAGGTWVEDLELGSYAGVHCTVTEFRKDVLAVATVERGFATLWPDHRLEAFDRAHGFSSDWITAVETDHEGNLWAGTAGGGLALLRPRQVQTVAPPDGWQGRSVLTVLRDRSGAMWVGTEGAGLYRHEGASWTNYSSSNGLSNPFVWSLAEDRQGSLWAGTWGAGLFIKTGDRFQRAAGTESIRTPVMALYPVEEGLWGGTHDGVFLYSGGKVAWFRPEDPAPDIRCLIKGEDSTLWAGTSGKGLLRIHKGEIKRFTRRDGLPSDSIRCLHQDEAGALWIGTFGGGLSRLKQGRFSTVGRPQGLPDNSIYDIQDDGAGCFWMSSCNGILRASKPELNGCADGTADTLHCLQYGRGDGMPTLECSGGLQPAGCKTLDGRLWFPTSRGLVAVDPGQVQTNQLPPPVVIENLLVNDEPLPGRASAGQRLTMSPGGRRFEFQYTALSFVAPERVRFQYRLEGLDAKWVNAGTRRTANYSYLPHGDYTFQVIACNNDNVWNRTGARLDFSILPYFWQTLWFQGLSLTTVVALVGGGVWYGTRRRMRRALELLERQRAIERERFRIARDIHDDLGASLTRINLLSQSVSRAVDGPEQVSQDLRRISDTVRQTMRTMDEIVWAVDPKHDTVDSLANYLSKLAQDLMAASDIRCRLDFPLHLPPWPLTAEVRHNLFLAFKEILHNAIRHSQASEVNITLQTEPEGFALIVEDNGSGFAIEPAAGQSFGSPTASARGHGLRNIRQRLTEIGGACEIVSQPGQGTRISLRVRLSGAGR